jgi:K+-transporting ATPase ATPase C chain
MGPIVLPALRLLVVLSLLTGVAYPACVTVLAQTAFPAQANGSLLRARRAIVGSALIGQPFSDPRYFWGRPSATASHPYNAAASTGSNLGPTNPALREVVTARIAALRAVDPANRAPVPVDLITASGSGLDPHISPAAALYQLKRVARERQIPEARLRGLVDAQVEGRTLGLLGEPRVNVLRLNLALDAIGRDGV